MTRTISLFVLLIGISGHVEALELTAVDVEGITAAVRDFFGHPILLSSITGASPACTYTAEAGCSMQVQVLLSPSNRTLTVSKVDGKWTIGQWQRELLNFEACVIAKQDWKGCYPPSGHVGGQRERAQ
jgi:hypothetical protein